VLAHQDREQLSSRQVAAIYDTRNPNQVMVWRRNFDQRGAEALENRKQGRLNMKPERSCQAPPPMVATDSAQTLLEENERLRAEVAYLKKLQALIRLKRSAAPTKRI
jgi:transposase